GLYGNGIPASGAFSPNHIPQEMLDVYNWVLSQSGSFNVYWPGPEGATYPWSDNSAPSFAQVDSPRPTFLNTGLMPGMFPAALQYLLTANLTADIAPYLGALNIRYLVLQPYSRTGLDYSWGIGDLGTLKTILQNSPG